MQLLIKIQIYNKNNNTWRICITTFINPPPISALGLILQSRVDMGCDTDFDMYYSLFIYLSIPFTEKW